MLSSNHGPGAHPILFYHKVNAMRIPCGVHIRTEESELGGGGGGGGGRVLL